VAFIRSVYTKREHEYLQREHERERDFLAVLPFKKNTNQNAKTSRRLSRRLAFFLLWEIHFGIMAQVETDTE